MFSEYKASGEGKKGKDMSTGRINASSGLGRKETQHTLFKVGLHSSLISL